MTGSLVRASKLSKILRGRHYDWLKREDYAKAFDRARLERGDALEGKARSPAGCLENAIEITRECYKVWAASTTRYHGARRKGLRIA